MQQTSSPHLVAVFQDVFNETRSILEPAGAVAVAGVKAFLQHYGLQGKRIVAVTSGANMNFDRLRLVSGGSVWTWR
jgi:threonine dehydratase